MKRKRAPGGGRKPKGEFSQLTSSLTIRIPDDMRKQLESEAAAKNQVLSQRLLWHLRQSFNRELDNQRDPALRGLLYLIANLAEGLALEGPASEFQTYWRTNWLTFSAFKIAVGRLLDALEEPPKPRSYPPTEKAIKEYEEGLVKYSGYTPEFAKRTAEIRRSPEALGAFEFSRLWEQAHRSDPLSQEERELARVLPQIERDFYTLPKAWKALGLKSKTRKPKDKADD